MSDETCKAAASRTPTAEEVNRAVALVLGTADRWVLMKRGLYYRPNGKGYTADVSEAWVLTEKEADEHTYPHDEPVTKHPAPLRDYHGSLDACVEMERSLLSSSLSASAYVDKLCEVVALKSYDSNLRMFYLIAATAPQRCEAFLRLHGKWEGLCK
jgi:hypothetical protein